jgi:hypothetical protein
MGNNIFVNEDGMIQITDFCMNRLAKADFRGFLEECWTPNMDIRAFLGLLSYIVVGSSAGRKGWDSAVPSFVSIIIERGLSPDPKSMESFHGIFETLKWNGFKIMEGVDSDAVSRFVNWIESSEQLTE